MYESALAPVAFSSTLRRARRELGLTIAQLAAQAGVSPRLVSEFERGQRPHVSLATACGLLRLVGVHLRAEAPSAVADEPAETAERAERRRQTWVGQQTTLRAQVDPAPPAAYADRLAAVAQASRLGHGLRDDNRASGRKRDLDRLPPVALEW
jgi:HTH-type transcriptional regulator / antitoxin HipB